MVEVRVSGVAVDSRMQPVVLLKPVREADAPGTVLPIWVGSQEAASISMVLEGEEPPRPLSHDLMRTLLTELQASLQRVEVTRVEGGTFYAEITLRVPDGIRTLDARPSDAIALALRCGTPIRVADAVLLDAGVPERAIAIADEDAVDAEAEALDEPDGRAPGDERAGLSEAELTAFQRFLDDVDPDDFKG